MYKLTQDTLAGSRAGQLATMGFALACTAALRLGSSRAAVSQGVLHAEPAPEGACQKVTTSPRVNLYTPRESLSVSTLSCRSLAAGLSAGCMELQQAQASVPGWGRCRQLASAVWRACPR